MLWVSLCRLPDTLSPEHKMHNQKVKHLQTEEKVFDSLLLCNTVLQPLHTIIALLAGRDLWSL